MKTMFRAFAGVAPLAALLTITACGQQPTDSIQPKQPRPSAQLVTGAAFTTVNETVDGTGHCANGNPSVNCNIYDGKDHVWLSGGPKAAYVGDGPYFFAVLEPGGQADPNDGQEKVLSTDTHENRTFTVTDGAISYAGTHDFEGNKIRLMPYSDTPNPGGVYVLAICSLKKGYPVAPSSCKYDAFKVSQAPVVPALALTVSKSANGADTKTFGWGITKVADKTIVKQIGGTATFTYTVSVAHAGGAISDVKVTGVISVTNPNVDGSSNTVPVEIDGVVDQLSDGTVCTVAHGGPQTLTAFKTEFPYECNLGSALPVGQLDNTVTVTWSEQILDNSAVLEASSADWTFSNIAFKETLVDDCITVADSYAGDLGKVCVGDEVSPFPAIYGRTVSIPQFGCQPYGNTATFTTSTAGITGSASQTVHACGPIQTGALTIGFWQNKNGQALITGLAKTGTCPLNATLLAYAPFQDLAATATCAQAAGYVYNVIKAANASGSSMNAMLKAQMLATALDVRFMGIGAVGIDLQYVYKPGTGAMENVSAAFGGAPALTVSAMLAYAASQSNPGGTSWYGQVKAVQELAKDAFDAINNQWAFAP